MKYILAVFLVIISLFSSSVYAQTELPSSEEYDYGVTATDSATDQVEEYTLPYPGILPDNLLYPIKVFRDRIVSFLISDPLKKAEFNLLQADKRLQAGV